LTKSLKNKPKNISVMQRYAECRFYHLVAAKIPEGIIRETLSEVRVDGARDPARLFTYKIQRYALEARKRGLVKTIGNY
jgi:hypothetical protein